MRQTIRLSVSTLILGLAVQAWAADNPLRPHLDLRGTWQTAVTTRDAMAAPDGPWTDIALPKTTWQTPDGGAHYLWYRREIQIPADWTGKRVFVDVRAAKYAPHVFVDGKLAGEKLDGWTPLEVEITSLIKPGSTHRLEIRCQDRSATFREGFVLPPRATAEQIRGSVLAPVGGQKDACGPWLPIYVEAYPQQRILSADLAILPSTRQGSLSVLGKVDGSSGGLTVQGTVLDGSQQVLQLGAIPISQSQWSVSAPFPNAHYWSPEDPHLYTLRLSLMRDGTVVDQFETPFGFKEIWAEGPDFYLNGVKRHLLASSTWPITEYETPEAIAAKVKRLREDGVNTFRFHTQPWQEEWLEAADKLGLLVVDEAAVYTDGEGFYAYQDERFWQNYRNHIEGMIKRDRNHPSVIMWSLGNETLFMGNQRYDAQLPKKLGDLSRFVKSFDLAHLTTYEADLDPDGAYGVLGLHYPHEMPEQHAYPNAADWITGGKLTEAGGGMLGQRRSKFYWDRAKPLYIGEYLWLPYGDYSVGTVFYGDDAYLNRDHYYDLSKAKGWIEQTIAYRRDGVSALCPWSPYGFGAGRGDPILLDAQKVYFHPVAAFLRNREQRLYAGDSLEMTFDVMNDSAAAKDLTLTYVDKTTGKAITSQQLTLAAGGYQPVTFRYTAPASPADVQIDSVLSQGDRELHRESHPFHITQRTEVQTPAGKTLVTFNASKPVAFNQIDPASTIVIIGAGALGSTAGTSGIPTIGGSQFDTASFLAFLERGGRAVVLEQQTLAPLGLGLTLTDYQSTMTFPLSPTHPLLAGMTPEDLKFWYGDNYVANKQIRRPTSGGARTVVVSGGSRSLDQSPVIEMPVGSGTVVLMQALIGAKSNQEPAAAKLLQNAVNYLASLQVSPARPVALVSDDPKFDARLAAMGISIAPADEPKADSGLLIAHGGKLAGKTQVADFVRNGGTLYWHMPTAAAFESLRSAIGAEGLQVESAPAGTTLRLREHPLLWGIAREDVTYTTAPQGWEHTIQLIGNAATQRFVPAAGSSAMPLKLSSFEGGIASADGVRFDRRGKATLEISADHAGLYQLIISASGTASGREGPMLRADANGVTQTWFDISSADAQSYVALVDLPQGKSQVELLYVNGAQWGGDRILTLHGVKLASADYPAAVEVLERPGALVTWQLGKGRVVLDGTTWDATGPNEVKGQRYASALLRNLGASFTAPKASQNLDAIPLPAFHLVGESPYFDARADEITCRANATLEVEFACARAGEYILAVHAYSTPAGGKYAIINAVVDDKNQVGQTEIASAQSKSFELGRVQLLAGKHKLRLIYANDEVINGEDRNLFIQAIGATLAR